MGDQQAPPPLYYFSWEEGFPLAGSKPSFVDLFRKHVLNFYHVGDMVGPCNLDELEAEWDKVEKEVGALHHRVNSIWITASSEQWHRQCQLIARATGLKFLRIFGASQIQDDQLTMLLEHVPQQQISQLKIFNIGCDLRQTFEKLRHFQQLEELHLSWSSPPNTTTTASAITSPASMEMLADSIDALPILREIQMTQWVLHNPKQCWEPVVCALGNKPNMSVSIDRDGIAADLVGNGEVLPNNEQAEFQIHLIPYYIDQEQIDALLNGPSVLQLLQQVKRKRLIDIPDDNMYNGRLDKWIDAMILLSKMDRLDCFHYLLAQLPPELFCGFCNCNEDEDIIPWRRRGGGLVFPRKKRGEPIAMIRTMRAMFVVAVAVLVAVGLACWMKVWCLPFR